MNIQASFVNTNQQKIYVTDNCLGNFHSRIVRAIKGAAISLASLFGFAEKVVVAHPALPKKCTSLSFSQLSIDVTRLIAAQLNNEDLQKFRLVETFTNRCVTNYVVNERLATLDTFTAFLGHYFKEELSAEEKEQLVLKPEFRARVLNSTLKTLRPELHSMKFVLVGLLMKHLSLHQLGRFHGLCWESKIKVPQLRGNSGYYFNKDIVETAKDFSKMYSAVDKDLGYWLNEGFIESNIAYFFEIDLIAAQLEKSISEGELRHGLSTAFKNMFYKANKYPSKIPLFVQKIEKLIEIVANISDEQLKTFYINNVLDRMRCKNPNSTLVDVFSKGITSVIESLSNEERKTAFMVELKLFLANPEDPYQCANKLSTHRVIWTSQ